MEHRCTRIQRHYAIVTYIIACKKTNTKTNITKTNSKSMNETRQVTQGENLKPHDQKKVENECSGRMSITSML